MKYFYFHISEDGDVGFGVYTKEQFKKEFLDVDEEDMLDIDDFITEGELKENGDPNYWPKHCLLIKGEIIQPRGIEKIIKYEID